MLAVGVAAGAAIGPAPDASFAGGSDAFAKRLPGLLAAIIARSQPAPATTPPAPSPQSPPACPFSRLRGDLSGVAGRGSHAGGRQRKPRLGRILVPVGVLARLQIDRSGRHERMADRALRRHPRTGARPAPAAPYIDGQIAPASTTAQRLVGTRRQRVRERGGAARCKHHRRSPAARPLDRAAALPRRRGGSLVRDRHARSADGRGQLPPGDARARSRTRSPTANTASSSSRSRPSPSPSQSGLPAGASTRRSPPSRPRASLLLSPFAKAGAHDADAFNPTSPKQSLEQLLH